MISSEYFVTYTIMIKKIIKRYIITSIYRLSWVYAQEIPFATILNMITTDHQIQSTTNDASVTQVCTRNDKGNYYTIAAVCLTQWQLPSLWFEESIQSIRPHIQWFDTTYDLNNSTFSYYGEQPDLHEQIATQAAIRHHPKRKQIVEQLSVNNTILQIPKYILAIWKSSEYWRYVTPRMLQWSRCTQTNYRIAISSLNNLLLQPWELLNFNTHIDRLPGYCKGVGNQNLMFFGWVCWASSQLFRTALLIPWLTVTKRAPHSQRYTQYYSDSVRWDDAAIYQMYKQFEVRNDSNQPLYFKILQTATTSYLVAISPQLPTTYTTINKQQIWPLRGMITKDSVDRISNQIIQTQSRTSQYQKKNTSRF